MPKIQNLGDDTISQLERAAARRFAESDWLIEGGYVLAAIYFYGYVSEMLIGAAYFRTIGFGVKDPIHKSDRDLALTAARSRSRMRVGFQKGHPGQDDSHPIDGWAELLIEERAFHGNAFDEKVKRSIRYHSAEFLDHWRPRLRYRSMDVSEAEVGAVRRAAEWFLKNDPRL